MFSTPPQLILVSPNNRTEQVQRALPFRLQVQSGDNGLLIARRGLVRDLEDMLDLIDLRVLPFRTSVGGDAFALPSRNMPLRCVLPQRSARVGGVRARARFFSFFVLLPFSTFLVWRGSRGRSSGRAGRMRIGRMSRPSWVMHHWGVLSDVVGSDEEHALRVLAVHAAGESSAFRSSCVV